MVRSIYCLLLCLSVMTCAPGVGGVAGASKKGAPVPYGQATELAPGEVLRVGEGTPIITFLAVVSDSRCPKGANCVRAGEAIVRIRTEEEEVREEVISNQEGIRPLVLPSGRVVILGLDPYPVYRTETTPEAYRLRVIVGEPEKR